MFTFLFKYPAADFAKGHLVFLSDWPRWLLLALALGIVVGLALVLRSRFFTAASTLRLPRAVAIWILQSMFASLVLLLLWRPALALTELKPQQNIVAILVDDSRSMATADGPQGETREAQALDLLQHGLVPRLEGNFQVRVYAIDSSVKQIPDAKLIAGLQPFAAATHLGSSLQQFVTDTRDLPIGAIVLLSDGAENAGGLDAATVVALRSRQLPVHTIGLGDVTGPADVEMSDVQIPSRALENSRLAAQINLLQHGYSGRDVALTVRQGDKLLASRNIKLGRDNLIQRETLFFNVGAAGAKVLQFGVTGLAGEQNRDNNSVDRLINVENDKRRILYIEGEPRWEYKFIRRAEDDDHMVALASMLRTTENKIYRQGLDRPDQLAGGFPSTADELFSYQGLIIGSVNADYFTPQQRELIREFVDRRGGGVLFLAGRYGLADGGWGESNLAPLLPVILPHARNTYHYIPATVDLTPAGADNTITQLADEPAANLQRWRTLPYLMDYQDPGVPKLGAAALADMVVDGHRMPMLVIENFGRGRSAVLATSGTWRWQMNLPNGDPSHAMFWQQLLRWLVTDTPGHVAASIPAQMLFDDGAVHLTAEVRDQQYESAPDAEVQAHIIGPDGVAAQFELNPVTEAPGTFAADWNAPLPGAYLTEVTARRGTLLLGRDVLTFQRKDGVAEHFHTQQNRELLKQLAAQTGGAYWTPQNANALAAAVPLSKAGITVRDLKELWDMPVVLLLLVLLRAGEWILRRKWGVV